jgi:hypothetical protein
MATFYKNSWPREGFLSLRRIPAFKSLVLAGGARIGVETTSAFSGRGQVSDSRSANTPQGDKFPPRVPGGTWRVVSPRSRTPNDMHTDSAVIHSSSPRRQGSRKERIHHWIPACAGMTYWVFKELELCRACAIVTDGSGHFLQKLLATPYFLFHAEARRSRRE